MMSRNRLIVFLLLLGSVSLGHAGEVIQSVQWQPQQSSAEIRVKLAFPVSYRKHFPQSRGKIVQVQLKADSKNTELLSSRDTFDPPASMAPFVRDVIYEGGVRGGPYLVIRFTKVTRFDVEHVNDKDEFVISIDHEQAALQLQQVDAVPTMVNEEADKLMREARLALTQAQNQQAILLFTQLISMPNHPYTQDAREYLGLARQRNAQLDMAKEIYEKYLEDYKDTRGAERVRQRLLTLQSRISSNEKNLQEAKRDKNKSFQVDQVFGRWAQYAYAQANHSEGNPVSINKRLLLSFADVSRRIRDEKKELRFSFSGIFEADWEDAEYEPYMRAGYAEYKTRDKKIYAAGGRLSINNGGVLGRFDGLHAGYRIKPQWQFFAVAGVPVDLSEYNSLQTERPTVGARIELDEFHPNWKGSVYTINQQVLSLVNRRALGGDVRFFKNKDIFYGLLDYDYYYQSLNFMTAHWGSQVNKHLKLDFHFDRRLSPVMFLSNALLNVSNDKTNNAIPLENRMSLPDLGDPPRFPTMGDLIANNEPANIVENAKGKTAISTLITMGATYRWDQDRQLTGNFTLSKYVPGEYNIDESKVCPDDPLDCKTIREDPFFVPVGGYDYIFSTEYRWANFYRSRDVFRVRAQGSLNDNRSIQNEGVAKRNRRAGLSTAYRLPINELWRADMRLSWLWTQSTAIPYSSKLSPWMSLTYRHNKKLTVNMDASMDYETRFVQNLLFANIGYHYIF